MDTGEASDEALWARAAEDDSLSRAEALSELGVRFFGRRDFEQCFAVAEQAAHLFKGLGDDEREGRNLYGAAACLCRLDRHDEAITTWAQAAKAYRRGGRESDIADCDMRAAECLQALDRCDEARSHFRSALDLYASEDNRRAEGETALSLGELEGQAGDFATAGDILERARLAFRAVGAASDVARATDRLAAARIEQGRLPNAGSWRSNANSRTAGARRCAPWVTGWSS